jgi:hypothetical protein
MSVHISSLVWNDTSTEGSERLLLLALADMSNDEGYCWPSVERLRLRVNLKNSRSVQKLMASLEQKGLLQRHFQYSEKGQRTSLFRVCVESLVASEPGNDRGCPTGQGVSHRSPGGCPTGQGGDVLQGTGGVSCRTPRTINRTVIESSEDKRDALRAEASPSAPVSSLVSPGVEAPESENPEPTATKQATAPQPATAPKSPRAPAAPRAPRASTGGTRIPEDFLPRAEDVAAIRADCPGLDLRRATASFKDYWASVPDAKGRKSDWFATWRVSMRANYDSHRFMPGAPAAGAARPPRETLDEAIAHVRQTVHELVTEGDGF